VALLIVALAGAALAEDGPVGWASIEGGTTGGEPGPTVAVSNAAAFIARAESAPPLVIRVSGTIRLPRPVRVKSNKTILGVGSDATITGNGFQVSNVRNVVICHLTITGAPVGINIESGANHIWVDHCDLSKCTDKLLNIKRGADLVTVSWNHFHDHGLSCLVGHSDGEDIRELDQGHLRVTYHHNYFDGTVHSHPRRRFAEPVHVFNNYYLNNQSGTIAVMDSGVLVEGNVFENVPRPTYIRFGDSPDPGRLVERENLYINSGKPDTRGTVAEPRNAYRYTLDKTSDVARVVREGAGPGKGGQ
jgi:pectate lyase